MIDAGFEFGGADGRRFVLEQKLGQGGMGAVFRARDRQLDRPVAIKVILPELTAAMPRALELFEREAQALAKIRDAGVVAIHDFGAGEDGADRFVYLVMELVDGKSLGSDDQVPARPLVEAVRIVRDLARRVDVIHQAGVLHRDLKPQNVMVRADGTVTVIDFGIAKPLASGTGAPNVTGFVSPCYSPPEAYALHARINRASDVYSLARILLALAQGRHPVDDTVPTPPAIADVVERATHVDRARRYQSAAELADALDRVLASFTRPRPPRRAALAVAGAGVVAIGAGLFAGKALRGGGAARPATAAASPSATTASTAAANPTLDASTAAVIPAIDAAMAAATIDAAPAPPTTTIVDGALEPAEVPVRRGWERVEPPAARATLGIDPPPAGSPVKAFVKGVLYTPDHPYQIQRESRDRSGSTWPGARDDCAAIGARLPTEAEWEWASRQAVFAPRGEEWTADVFRENDGRRVEMSGDYRLRTVRGVPAKARKEWIPPEPVMYRDSLCEQNRPSCPGTYFGVAHRCVRDLP